MSNRSATTGTDILTAAAVTVNIRWLIRRDMDEVLEIEKASFENPWSDDDFIALLRNRNCIGMVAELDHELVGFMLYELHRQWLHVLDFAVALRYRRRGVGTQLVDRLIGKLSQQRRKELVLELRESNLDAQLFFRSQGFHATNVLRRHYDDTGEDAYVMTYLLDEWKN